MTYNPDWGTGGGGITDLTGNVTASGTGSVVATIAADAVTNAKLADMAANSLKGNNTGAPANPADLTAAQVKTLLAIANTDVSGLGTLATQSGTFSGTSSGTNTGDQTITLTGEVTGTGTGSFAATIANSAVTLAKQANLAANSIIGNNTGSPATPLALTAAQVKTLLAIASGDVSGLGTLATQSGTFSGTSSGTNTGDNAINSLYSGLVSNATHTGEVTGATALTIANDAVTYAKMQNVSAASRLLGRGSAGGAGDVEELTLNGLALTATALAPTALLSAQAPGTVSLATATTMLQYERLTLASTDRLTNAGTGRTIVLDFGEDAARGPQGELAPTGTVILGTPKSPTMSFTVLSDYELDLTRRVTLNGTTRATLQGNANLVLQNAPANSGRITLTGRG